MTEQEWLAFTDPLPMLECLRGTASARKLRLFEVACCRRVWHLLIDDRSRLAVEAAERFADGLVTEEELRHAFSEACDASITVHRGIDPSSDTALKLRRARNPLELFRAASMAAFAVGNRAGDIETQIKAVKNSTSLIDGPTRSHFLRDIFGNPFRPSPAASSWLTPKMTPIVLSIYDDRIFDSLPILGNGLEELGVSDQAILNHCRQPGEHVRGCWVLDLLLGKE
jgi:hypothetical protein